MSLYSFFAKVVKSLNWSRRENKEPKPPCIYIKIVLSNNYLYCIRVLKWRKFKNSTKIYISYLQKETEYYLAFTTFTAFGITNAQRLMKERLKTDLFSNCCQGLKSQLCPNQQQGSRSHPAATTSNSFINVFNIGNSTHSTNKVPTISYSLWHRYCCFTGIKNSTSAACRLCKHTLEVMVCMFSTAKERLRPNI